MTTHASKEAAQPHTHPFSNPLPPSPPPVPLTPLPLATCPSPLPSLGTISNVTTRASKEAARLHNFRKKINRVVHWLQTHNVPLCTRTQVRVRGIEG